VKPNLLFLAAGFAFTLAGPALAWSGSAQAGAYQVTATMAPDTRSLSLAVASSDAKPAAVHAWFIDSEGLILGPAAMPAHAGGQLVAYNPAVQVPDKAAAVVVMAQPDAARAAADGDPDAQVTQISLPTR
jgi:hypothetical protein